MFDDIYPSMFIIPQLIEMGISLTLIGIPYLVVHTPFIGIMLYYRIVPIRYPQVSVGTRFREYRSCPRIGTRKNITAIHFLIARPILYDLGNMHQMAGRFAYVHLILVFLGIVTCSIKISPRRRRISSPDIHLL